MWDPSLTHPRAHFRTIESHLLILSCFGSYKNPIFPLPHPTRLAPRVYCVFGDGACMEMKAVMENVLTAIIASLCLWSGAWRLCAFWERYHLSQGWCAGIPEGYKIFIFGFFVGGQPAVSEWRWGGACGWGFAWESGLSCLRLFLTFGLRVQKVS